MENLNKYIICQNENIRDAIKKMDEGGIGFAVCVGENENVIGVISDGDFRRAVLNGMSLNENVLRITNKNFKYLKTGYLKEDVLELFRETVAQHLPILENGKLIEIITEEDFYDIRGKGKSKNVLNIPVVIMAGGKGTRLDPFTRILPKPLIPIGDKTMIEIIMDEYTKYGLSNFYISVNHKAKMIKAYFDDQDIDYNIKYIDESQPLGTAGALKFLEDKIDSTFFVSNCDIIIKEDYCKIHKFHKDGKFDLTLVASMQHHTVPYGVCEIENEGHLKEIREKPEYDFLVNAGMYLLEPSAYKLIPIDEYFDMTDLIMKAQKAGLSVGVYPISEKSYIDVGQLGEYKKTLKLLFDD
ncbi:MAG: hypothetical protein SRB1_02029 [Desulfobacteraceae bacterium Eth-SRB1]|nr:MAG: hypothetical protein SRB1_02029 [Desulfobacteraceae bacterium Eth-SRB1]